ncbi:MAG TPA: ABC transporter permease [Pyrinomonadaceae bacterium]|jgi:ABC-type antimicrobial peptide transport system permease subunit|nr:ABC transporter permease [Pyrinomonadaceae bacterium]
MQTAQLLKRSLVHYWRTNLAVVAGVAIAVAVLAGALLVGNSVRASLRDLFLQKLGNTDYVVTSSGFFREQLAADIQSQQQFASAGLTAAVPLIALPGTITHDASGRVASDIRVYGIDEKFWAFQNRQNHAPVNREILVSDSLAAELGSRPGDSLLLRLQTPNQIPVESLYSRKEDLGRTLRLNLRDALSREALGEFSVQPQQGPTRAVFVSLKMLQRELQQEGRANLILIAESAAARSASGKKVAALDRILHDATTLEDFGIKLQALEQQQVLSVGAGAGLISAPLAGSIERTSAAAGMGNGASFLSYLSNSIRRADGREIPYSIVTGIPGEMWETLQHADGEPLPGCKALEQLPSGEPSVAQLPPILLNDWAAKDLDVKPGERVTLDYYVWLDEGKLATRSAEFRLACVIPMSGLAADRDLVPDYPGITESATLGDWNPPFPIDLKHVRPQDEDYWKKYRTTPKAFIPLPAAQQLWQSRFGKVTSIRSSPAPGQNLEQARTVFDRTLRETINPAQVGLSILPVRAQGLQASQGATDFGEYFLYFSFFLVVSALMLSALFFKLGIEQRLREIGVLQAVGFPAAKIRAIFLTEGLLLAVVGSLIGLAGAVGYGEFVIVGLRTWWVDAVGTTMLRLYISPLSLGLGAAGGIIAALLCVIWTLRGLGKKSTRSLLSGATGEAARAKEQPGPRGVRRFFTSFGAGTILGIGGLILLLAAALQLLNQVAGFFGGGTLILSAALCFQSAWLRQAKGKPISSPGWWSVVQLGFRNATSRPGRSVLCIALIASAAFIIVAVDSFRHREGPHSANKKSGSGGFPLLAESLLPMVHNPNTSEGQEALNLRSDDSNSPLAGITFARFRVRPGDDASCLNLYQPQNPKIIAPTDDFLRSNRFVFQSSVATTNEEKNNPWLLLLHEFPDGAIPTIVDANSLTYVLHKKLGDDLTIETSNGPVRLRLVASLSDSVFQSELLMSEQNFIQRFPDQQGYRFFLIDTPAPEQSSAITTELEKRLSDLGFDVQATSDRLAAFHRVENTYLSTFQMLGGLGLVLGTLGMAAVLLRNVLERRRELALLRVVGYNSSHFAVMVIAENALLLCCGLITGTLCALVAIAPVFFSRSAQLPGLTLGLLLIGVLISGLTASVVATWAAMRSPLLPALRAE